MPFTTAEKQSDHFFWIMLPKANPVKEWSVALKQALYRSRHKAMGEYQVIDGELWCNNMGDPSQRGQEVILDRQVFGMITKAYLHMQDAGAEETHHSIDARYYHVRREKVAWL